MLHRCTGVTNYVDTQTAVEALAQQLRVGERVALDTEADSLHHYFEKVCLIQLSFEGGHYLVDPLAGIDVRPIIEQLEKCVLILHGADYDLRMMRRQWQFEPERIFDTMCAAQLLGLEQLGLASLVERCCGVTLSKSCQRADWSRRPLPPKLIEYATNDTRYLLCVADKLAEELRAHGRLEWHEEACRRILENARVTKRENNREGAWRVKGWHNLKSLRAQAILRELYHWREHEAQHADLPPFRILSNEMLVRLAEWADTAPNPHELPPLPRSIMDKRQRLESLKKTIMKALELPVAKWPKPKPSATRECKRAPERLCMQLRAIRDRIAKEQQLPPQLILPASALNQIASTRPRTREELKAVSNLCNWQFELIGAPFLAALEELEQNESMHETH